jgi:hypothetical protein
MTSQQLAFNADQQDRDNQFEQAISLVGWQELGDWSAGITVDNRNQIVWYGNSWYRHIGTLPYVTSGSGPDEDGGYTARRPDLDCGSMSVLPLPSKRWDSLPQGRWVFYRLRH